MEKTNRLKSLFLFLFLFSLSHSLYAQGKAPFISLICNGKMPITSHLRDKIIKSDVIIGVDGGINYCHAMHITPDWVVGDFDSVDPDILRHTVNHSKQTKLLRNKDVTDLEFALERALADYPGHKIVIFGGLGGRIDHTLGNIYLLLRHPGTVFIESEEQILFALDDKGETIDLSAEMGKTVALFPLMGPVNDIIFQNSPIPLLDKKNFFITPLVEKTLLKVGKGVVLVVVDKRALTLFPSLTGGHIMIDNSPSKPVIQLLRALFYQSTHGTDVVLHTETEEIHHLIPSLANTSFPTTLGKTISLIPFFGKARGIKTKGLKWELGEGVTDLENGTMGISNVSMSADHFTISVNKGELLCIINHTLIDHEMVKMPLKPNL